MSDRRERGNLAPFVWGGLFLFCGIVLLLQTSGVLPWSLWATLWRFWPVLIILGGLSFIVPRQRAWLMVLIVLALVGAGTGILLATNRPSLSGDVIHVESYTVPLDGIKQADVTIDFSAGAMVVANTTATGSANLVEASPEVRHQRSTMEGAFSKTGDTGVLTLKAINQQYWGGGAIRWELDFTPRLPLDMTVKCSAATANLDLQQLQVRNLRLDVDACSGEMTLPAYSGTATVEVHADVSNLDITVPAGVAVKIQANTSISVVEIDQTRFPKQGDYYVSPDFESAASRVVLNITCDVGRITVK